VVLEAEQCSQLHSSTISPSVRWLAGQAHHIGHGVAKDCSLPAWIYKTVGGLHPTHWADTPHVTDHEFRTKSVYGLRSRE
jgi:hypothetical protein